MIGVLALQGAFQKHLECLSLLGVQALLVKTEKELHLCDALILPGGESTAHHCLMTEGLWEALKIFTQSKPTLGTCCGLILMSKYVKNHSMSTLGVLDLEVQRNAYGPQIASFETEVEAILSGETKRIKGCFIRAPQITKVEPQVSILATHEGSPVIVQQNLAIAATFHPELLLDLTLHRYFLSFVSLKKVLNPLLK